MLCAYVGLMAFADRGATPTINNASLKGLTGTKIAIADAYDIYWVRSTEDEPIDNPTSEDYQGNIFLDNKSHRVGWESSLNILNDSSEYSIVLYDGISVPVNRITEAQDNGNTLGFWFATGVPLASVVSELNEYWSYNQKKMEFKTLYAIPEQWLLDWQDTTTYVINGSVNSDGSISFEGGIAFFIEVDKGIIDPRTGEKIISWSSNKLSPVYRNIRLVSSNGTHQFERFTDLDSVIYERFKLVMDSLSQDMFPGGNGGHISIPVDPRPIKTRLHNVDTYNIHITTDGDVPYIMSINQGEDETIRQVPVYISQVNDSTVHVYNLFGGISEANVFYLNDNGSMSFPVQLYDQSIKHSYYAYSDDPDSSAQTGLVIHDTISWGMSIPVEYRAILDDFYDEGSVNYYHYDILDYYFDNNRLYYTDGNVFIRRGDVNKDGNISISDVTAMIDALLGSVGDDTQAFSRIGADCNRDGEVSIGDVTFLIDYLLNGSWNQ